MDYWYLYVLLLSVALCGFFALSKRPVIVDYREDFVGMPRDCRRMTNPMRIHHLWMKAMVIRDQRIAIFEEACELHGVDPRCDSPERAIIQECFLDPYAAFTPGIAGIKLDELRRVNA